MTRLDNPHRICGVYPQLCGNVCLCSQLNSAHCTHVKVYVYCIQSSLLRLQALDYSALSVGDSIVFMCVSCIYTDYGVFVVMLFMSHAEYIHTVLTGRLCTVGWYNGMYIRTLD